MTFYLVRHGRTILNDGKTYYGATDVPLSEEGIKQAEKVSKFFQNIKLSKVYSSPLQRAKDTARIITGGTYTINIDERLSERNFGIFEKMTYQEITDKYQNETRQWESLWVDYKPPGGESFREQYLRTRDFLLTIQNEHSQNGDEDSALIVSHGGTIGIMLMILVSDDFAGEVKDPMLYWKFSVGNAGIVRVKYSYNNWYIDGIIPEEIL